MSIPTTVRHELGRILASEAFARCPRMQRFLAFVVEETLAGRAEELGEYGIGLEVFDRREDFQPQLDPIVRNDARRLRQKLHEYYRQAHGHEVIIEIPKGGYVPVFHSAAASRPAAAEGPPRLAVLPFEVLSSGAEIALLGGALGLALTAGFTDLEGLEVVAHGAVRPAQVREAAAGLRVTHVIQGALLHDGEICRAMISLSEASDATQLWAGEYEADLGDMLTTQCGIVACTLREVVTRLREEPSGSRRLTLVA